MLFFFQYIQFCRINHALPYIFYGLTVNRCHGFCLFVSVIYDLPAIGSSWDGDRMKWMKRLNWMNRMNRMNKEEIRPSAYGAPDSAVALNCMIVCVQILEQMIMQILYRGEGSLRPDSLRLPLHRFLHNSKCLSVRYAFIFKFAWKNGVV